MSAIMYFAGRIRCTTAVQIFHKLLVDKFGEAFVHCHSYCIKQKFDESEIKVRANAADADGNEVMKAKVLQAQFIEAAMSDACGLFVVFGWERPVALKAMQASDTRCTVAALISEGTPDAWIRQHFKDLTRLSVSDAFSCSGLTIAAMYQEPR